MTGMADQVQAAGFVALSLVALTLLLGVILAITTIRFEITARRARRRALRLREADRLATRQERNAQRALHGTRAA